MTIFGILDALHISATDEARNSKFFRQNDCQVPYRKNENLGAKGSPGGHVTVEAINSKFGTQIDCQVPCRKTVSYTHLTLPTIYSV